MHRLFAATILLLCAPLAASAPDSGAEDDLNCVILPDEEVEVSSPVPGVIEEVLVRRSERVVRGQVLARLESSVEEATLALASARAETDSELRLRRVEFGYDAQHRTRLQALHVRQATSSQSLEDAERVAEAARLRVRLAEDRRREALLERRRADAVLGLKTIRSPIDGVILERRRTVGEYVEDQPILRIARLDPLRVELIAPLALFGAVHEGMQVALRPETDPQRERVASVTAVDAVADPGSGTFGVELALANPDLALPAGIKCKGRLLPRIAGAEADPATGSGVANEDSNAETATADDPFGPLADLEVDTSSAEPSVRSDAPSPAICLAFDAVDDEAMANRLVRAAERLGGRALPTEADVSHDVGYIVLTPAGLDPSARRALVTRLEAAGITDLAAIGHGAYGKRISLGIYNGPRSAERRRVQLANLGFDAEVVSRTRTERATRLELELPPGLELDAALATLTSETGVDGLKAVPCGPIRTAAR